MEERPQSIYAGQQKRYISLLYTDLCESTRLATELEDEDYGEVLDQLGELFREVIPRHGGTLLQVHGDGAMAMFGFPNAGEEDVRLAVNTALALHDAVRSLVVHPPSSRRPLRLRLHSGVHSGAVMVEQGDVLAGSYQLRGEATNITARLSDAAAEDEILVSEESLRGSEPFYACEAQRTLNLRGMEGSLQAVPVVERAELETRYQARRARSLLPFSGREGPLGALSDVWHQALRGEVVLSAVIGAPGVGKTRLVDEFLSSDAPSGGLLLRGHCQNFEGTGSLEPFRTLLNHAVEQSAAAFPVPPEALLASFDEGGSELSPTAFAQLFRRYVETLLHGRPVVLFIDDWQWADEVSRAVLLELVNTVVGRLLVVLTSRESHSVDSGLFQGASLIYLDGLARRDVDAALKRVLPGSNPNARRRLAELSGGNPLFLEELCQARNLDELDGTPSAIEHVPRWLYSLVQSRVSGLAVAERSVAEVAAVIGYTVPLWLLTAVTKGDDAQALTGLAIADLLLPGVRDGELLFRHGLTREIVYDLIDVRARRRLHRATLEALMEADSENLPLLGYHAAQAGMREEAVRYSERAGDAARSSGFLETARTQYAAAMRVLDLEYVEDVEPYVALADKLMSVAILDPSTAELPLIEALHRHAGDTGHKENEALCNHWLGAIYYGLGRPRKALVYHARALALAQEQGIRWLVRMCDHRIGQAMATNCEHGGALRLLERATSRAKAREPGTPAATGLAYSLGAMSMVLGDQGHFDRSSELYARARTLMGDGPHPAGPNIGSKWAAVLIWQGRWAEARRQADEVAGFSEGNQNLYVYGMCQVLSAYARWHEQRDEALIERMRETAAWLEGSSLSQFASLNYGWLAELSLAVGADNDVRMYGARALWRARSGDELGLATAMRALGALALRGGTHREAAYYFEIAERSAGKRGALREQAHNDLFGAQLVAAAGNEVGERMLKERADATFARLGMHWHRAQLAQPR